MVKEMPFKAILGDLDWKNTIRRPALVGDI